MKRFRSVLILTLSALAFATGVTGCKHPAPPAEQADNLTVGKVQGEIKVGMDAASVAQILGSPNIVTTDEKRREVWIYDKVSSESVDTSNSFGGTIIIFGGQTSQLPALEDPEDADDHHQVRRGQEGPRLCLQLLAVLGGRPAAPPSLSAQRPRQTLAAAWSLLLIASLCGAGCAGAEDDAHRALRRSPRRAPRTRRCRRGNSRRRARTSCSRPPPRCSRTWASRSRRATASSGFLRAAKERSAREYGQEIRRDVVAFLTCALTSEPLASERTRLVT